MNFLRITAILNACNNVVLLANGNEFHEIQVQITPGVYFKPQPQAVMYEATVPLIYTLPWEVEQIDIERESLLKPVCNAKQGDDLCNMAKWMDSIDTEISSEINRANEVLISGKSMSRVPRSLDFVGNFMSFCCGVATASDFKSLFTDQNRLRNRIDSIKENIYENHRDITSLSSSMVN